MNIPPLSTIGGKLSWHLRRAVALPPKVIRYLFATPYYDLILARRKRTYSGKVRQTPRVAVFLIFPRSGVKASHLNTLRYLVAKGCAPIVVSNIPLQEADRSAVLDACWRLIERPNFGYDFGGYRDGILSLGQGLDVLEHLVLLNDSVWFPLPGSSDWLDDAAALGVDFAGAASNYGMSPQLPGDYRFSQWDYRSDNTDFHYCSFALYVTGQLLRDARFLRFWRRFRLTNDKIEVVQRGEVGLTQWVMQHGFSHGSTLDIENLDAALERCPLERVRQIVRELIIPEERELRAAKTALLGRDDGSNAWRTDAISFILLAVAQTGASYALPELTVREMGFPFLKKSPLWLDEDAAESTLAIARSLGGPDGRAILAEALELRS